MTVRDFLAMTLVGSNAQKCNTYVAIKKSEDDTLFTSGVNINRFSDILRELYYSDMGKKKIKQIRVNEVIVWADEAFERGEHTEMHFELYV